MNIGIFHGRIQHREVQGEPRGNVVRAVMFACPLLFSSFVAFKSRTAQDNFQVPEGSVQQDAQALAYIPYVKRAQSLLSSDLEPRQHRVLLVELGRDWERGIRSGKLGMVRPVSFEDTPGDGARGIIFHAKSRLVTELLLYARAQFKAGNSRDAVDQVLLAMRLSESLKYSDFESATSSFSEQKRAVELLDKYLARIPLSKRPEIRSRIAAILAEQPKLNELVKNSRLHYYDWVERMGKEPVGIEDVHQAVFITSRIVNEPTSKQSRLLARGTVLGTEEDRPEYLTHMRNASTSAINSTRGMRQLLGKL